jgi:hypothetical protein
MKKRKDGLYILQAVIRPGEKSQIATMILASGKSESSYVREMLGLDPLERGALVGNQNRTGKRAGAGRRKAKPKFEGGR